ncbi:MAG: dTMP kinase [Propionibacteriaceae bacterium]|nr:dTMP kinase [Propionibacteriaceae bacterium]
MSVAVPGLFIVFEGGDGAGKSTQSRLLVDWLRSQGREVVETRQPGGTKVGNMIRHILLDPATGAMDPKTEALLYAADKAQHIAEVIRPALDAGKVVVSDRFIDSMLAYQGAGRVLPDELLAEIAEVTAGGLTPDLTILLDLDPAAGIAALTSRDRLEQEGLEFHQRVRAGYARLVAAAPSRYVVIAARQPVAEIAAQIQAAVQPLL